MNYHPQEIIRRCLQARNQKYVLVSGCFDVLHVGHIRLIAFARNQGRVLVGINSDAAVQLLKGPTRPINTEVARLEVLDALADVFGSFVIDDTTVTDAILSIKPHIWVKGSDYTLETLNQEERNAAESVGTKIMFAPKVQGVSSTSIISQMHA